MSRTPLDASHAAPDTASRTETDTETTSGSSEDPGTVEVPARYAREIEKRERLHEQALIDVYVAGDTSWYAWPHRLVNAGDADHVALRDTCDTLIVDSVYGDDYYPVDDVLDAAHKIHADYVIMSDYPDQPDATIDAYEWFSSHYIDHACNATVIPVAQPASPDFHQQINFYQRSRLTHPLIAIGGLSSATPAEQVTALTRAREIAGSQQAIHGLGLGTSPQVIAAVRQHATRHGRPLIDSLDTSTPERAPSLNKLPDKTWSQHRHLLPEGESSTVVRAGFADAIARMLAYEFSPSCDDDVVTDVPDASSDLSHWQ